MRSLDFYRHNVHTQQSQLVHRIYAGVGQDAIRMYFNWARQLGKGCLISISLGLSGLWPSLFSNGFPSGLLPACGGCLVSCFA